jgi:hypothetical protein
MKNFKAIVTAIAISIVPISVGGCTTTVQDKPAIGATPNTVISKDLSPTTITTAASPNVRTNSLKPSVKIDIAVDLTTSGDVNRVPVPTISQIGDVVKVAMERGGDVRIDAIGSDSDKSMLAVSFAEPEDALPPLETPKEDNINPIERPKFRRESAVKQLAHTAAQQQFDLRVAQRNRDNQQKLKQFLAQVPPILKKRGSYNSTDIVGMVKRTNLFLNEPDPSKKREPQRIALLITDGLETLKTHPKKIEFADRTEVIIVCSGGEAGILKGQQFESIDSAIRYISHK